MLIENEGDDNSEASLKEGVDMRVSEQKHIWDHFQTTFMAITLELCDKIRINHWLKRNLLVVNVVAGIAKLY